MRIDVDLADFRLFVILGIVVERRFAVRREIGIGIALGDSDVVDGVFLFDFLGASNERQVLAVAEEIEKDLFLKCSGRQPRSREGLTEGQWVLLDYGDFVIHVMHEESREFYGLERLWRDCPAIDLELAHPETAEHAEDAAVTTA